MLITFCFGVSSNLSQQKSPTAEILCIYFLRTIFRRKYMRKISSVGLFCCNEFEETPKQKVINMSKLNKFHFNIDALSLIAPPAMISNSLVYEVNQGLVKSYFMAVYIPCKDVPVQPSSNLVNTEIHGHPRIDTSLRQPNISSVIPDI